MAESTVSATTDPNSSENSWIDNTWEMTQSIWNQSLFSVDGSEITIGRICTALIVLFAGIVFSRVIARHMGQRVLPRMKVERGPALAAQTVIFYLLLVLAVFITLEVASVPLTVFTIFGGALALGFGLGAQNLANNFISGLILMFERPVRVGDLVKVGTDTGTIEKIGARSTHVQAFDGISIIVPNSLFLEQPVTNWSYTDDRIRLQIAIGIAYGSNCEQARDILLEIAKDHPQILSDPQAEVYFLDFGDNALTFELHGWTNARSTVARMRVESDLRFAIDAQFREANICIAYPQRDVHIDTTAPLDVRLLPANTP